MKSFLLAAALALPLPAMAFDISSMSDAERTEFGAQVRAYLLENPQVLMEAIAVLEQRQADEQSSGDINLITANADDLFGDTASWSGGNPNGDVTLVEFLDYRCGYCRKAHPEVAELVKSDGNIRIVVKEFPILGEQSMMASQFALSVRQTEGDHAYAQVKDALMELRADISEQSLRALSDSLGLNTDAVMAGMGDAAVAKIIADNRALAQRLQINGTPSFVLPTQMLRGYLPLDAMRGVIAQVRDNG